MKLMRKGTEELKYDCGRCEEEFIADNLYISPDEDCEPLCKNCFFRNHGYNPPEGEPREADAHYGF